jgi:hypothetical protein
MAQQPPALQIHLTPSLPPYPATHASICIVNRIGQTIFLDFGVIDPLALGRREPGASVEAATHVGRIVMGEDSARHLRDMLNRILGEG